MHTPWKPPKPDIQTALLSSHKKSNEINHGSQTPAKSVKSKFIVPMNLTPFPLSPKTPSTRSGSNRNLLNLSSSQHNTKPFKNDPTSSSPLGSKLCTSIQGNTLLLSSDPSQDSEDEVIDLTSSEISLPMCPWKSPSVHFLTAEYFLTRYPSCPSAYNVDSQVEHFKSNFEHVKNLGSGSFANVQLVRAKETGLLYALKTSTTQFIGAADRYLCRLI